MTVLVTGATGFVGSAVARKLLAMGETVRVLVRENSDRQNIDDLAVEVCVGDLTQAETLKPAVRGCSAVFHVAADYRLWTRHPEEMMQTNIEGSKSLIGAALKAGVERVVYTSSVAALGINKDETPADETTPSSLEDMIGVYKRSKFLAEEAVHKLVAEKKAPVVIVNPSAPVGPRDIKPTRTGELIADAAAGRMPAFVDTGLNVVHVDDVAEGHVLAWQKGTIGERYILGGENLPLATILREISELVGRKPPRISIPHGVIMPIAYIAEALTRLSGGEKPLVAVDEVRMARKKMYFTSAKAERELGYRPRPVSEAFTDAISWFREHDYLG
ncbi:MAG: NAD-dependent epimerase/dehydratase family protein [Alphaproteobacteria bacterium]|nr:NAD-dependent epimerase/dehydratase family protein [Alphaproteobacteria bacterium]